KPLNRHRLYRKNAGLAALRWNQVGTRLPKSNKDAPSKLKGLGPIAHHPSAIGTRVSSWPPSSVTRRLRAQTDGMFCKQIGSLGYCAPMVRISKVVDDISRAIGPSRLADSRGAAE